MDVYWQCIFARLHSQYKHWQCFPYLKGHRMSRLKVDRELCEGYANCVFQAPEIFDLGDDNIVIIQTADVAPADHSRVEEAVASCPVAALSLEEG